VITIITNDGWWGNTAGHHQHMSYARLRAIETGLWVARSANTGISCFIDPYGHVYQPQPWDTQAAIKMDIPPNNEPGFYALHFDWVSRAVAVFAILFFIFTLYTKWFRKKQ
jgi:apolipoprotein N-acyltransferase